MTSQSFFLEDPSGCQELPFLSINVFYVNKKNTDIKPCKSNCSRIEVDILYPAPYLDSNSLENTSTDRDSQPIMEQAENSLSPTNASTAFGNSSHEFSSPINSCSSMSDRPSFTFLSLPIEIRRKIYLFLLPPRHHKIISQIPHNGYYFSPSLIPLFSAQSFYPISPANPEKLTTYKVFSTNSHYPTASIHTDILSVCTQTKVEAEAVLYGNGDTIWDFGQNIEAVKPFWLDRSRSAREWVRNLKIARDVTENAIHTPMDAVWDDFCGFFIYELSSLRTVDLTVWGEAWVPNKLEDFNLPETETSGSSLSPEYLVAQSQLMEKPRTERDLREWVFTKSLLELEGLRSAKVTWRGFREG